MKKRKKKRNKTAVRFRTEPDILQNIRFLNPDDEFHFECTRCGECCRNVEYSVMLEAYDLYRIARYLKQNGYGVKGIEDVIVKYTEVKTLENTDYTIFLLKTRGQRKECIFLKDGRCSIHKAKPKACRLYPLGAWPNDARDGFDYFIASQKQHHFNGSAIRVGDWMDANCEEEEWLITLMDTEATAELALIMRGLKKTGIDRDRILQPLILFKYVCFELDEPYIPQFIRNMDRLKNVLLSMVGSM